MENAKLECGKLVDLWATLKAARPSEMDFRSAGYPNINGDSFGVVFSRWNDSLALLTQKTKSTTNEDAQVADAVLTRIFRDLNGVVSQAQNSGLAWLLTTQFFQFVAEAQTFMTQYVDRRIGLRKELFKFAETQLSEQILNVEKAHPIASKVLEFHSKITAEAEAVQDAKTTATENAEAIATLKDQAESEIKKLKSLWESSTDKVIEFSEEATQAKESIEEQQATLSKLINDAKEALKLINAQKLESDSKIESGAKLIEQANDKLTTALQNINRQALAGAFTEQVAKIKTERIIWVLVFFTSIVWLLCVGNNITSSGDPKALFDWHNLLKGLPFAAPAVWLGWFSARQAGILSRIQQDYAYKAASAVAFEGYKKEVAAANDDALSRQLLETTMRNLGENPIRLYGKNDEPVMPMEQLLSSIKDESLWKRLIELLTTLKPSGK